MHPTKRLLVVTAMIAAPAVLAPSASEGQEGVVALGGGIEIPPNADHSGGATVTHPEHRDHGQSRRSVVNRTW